MDRHFEHAIEGIARKAGAVLMNHYGKLAPEDVSIKGGLSRDLVTVADKAAEAVIIEELQRTFPGVGILTEESGAVVEGTDRFVIDPLDGTTNFSQRLQHFGVSIAYEEQGKPDVGVIYAPYFDDMFAATTGNGARLNGDLIHVTSRTDPRELFVATGFACIRAGYEQNNAPNFTTMLTAVRAVRRLGACSLDMCYTACGIFDAYWELSLSPWDVAAGAVIVREAGGRISDLDGGYTWHDGSAILATNGHVHDFMINNLPVHKAR